MARTAAAAATTATVMVMRATEDGICAFDTPRTAQFGFLILQEWRLDAAVARFRV